MISWRSGLLKIATNRTLVVLLAAILAVLLTFNIASHSLDEQYKERALTVAKAVAAIPQVVAGVESKDVNHELQALTLDIAKQTGATYIVIADDHGIRLTHPKPEEIGLRIDGPLLALQGLSYTTLNNGSLGRSANGKTPVYGRNGKVVGLVSAGFLTSTFSGQISYLRQSFLLYGVGLIFLGFFLSELLSRKLRNKRIESELQTTRVKYQEREAMLHAINEGVITLTPDRRIILINDEAKRLLGLNSSPVGRPIDEVLPQGRLLDLIEGEVPQGDDELVLNENFSLRVNFRPVKQLGRDIGSVVTLRDRTEHIGLMRELDSVKNLTNALRAQQHEYSNRIHTLSGLIELKRYEEASEYLGEISLLDADLAETLNDKIANPTMTALLLAKVVIAREKGVTLSIDAKTSIDDLALDQNAQITVIGNLIDNAIEATAGSQPAIVVMTIEEVNDFKRITVEDSGHGLPEPNPEVVFEDGFSTKGTQPGAHRGLGLAIVHRLVKQAGGEITCRNRNGAIFTVVLPVKK